jgi:RNA polymerase sigma-70 factor (ECF subfamily)
MTSTASDAELVGRARRGELDAYAELVRRYQDLVIRVAFVITGNADDAQDVAQEAFIKAHSSLGRVQPAWFRRWLLRIVANEARNFLKAARRRREALTRAAGGVTASGPAPNPEMAVLADEQRTVLLRALDALREEDRLALYYRYIFDLSETDMVEALGWPRGTVKSRLARALVRFRQQVGHLALLPPAAFGLSHIARDLAAWNEIQLEHGLTGLGPHFLEFPTRDLSASVLPRLQAGGGGRGGRTSMHAATLSGAAVLAVAIAALAVRASTEPARPSPPPPEAAVRVVASPTVQAAPSSRTIVVYGADLSDPERAEISSWFDVGANASTETISRDEVLSTLAAAGLPASPDAETLSSVRLDCPGRDGSLSVRTEHITMLRPLTYVTALLAAGATDVSATVAAPGARPVTGETAIVGMLRAAGRCTGNQAQESARVNLGYLVLELTGRLAAASADWGSAGSIMARAVHAVVTGQARDESAIGATLDAAAAERGTALDGQLRAELAAALMPLVGQDYGLYAHGYRIEQSAPDQARFIR